MQNILMRGLPDKPLSPNDNIDGNLITIVNKLKKWLKPLMQEKRAIIETRDYSNIKKRISTQSDISVD